MQKSYLGWGFCVVTAAGLWAGPAHAVPPATASSSSTAPSKKPNTGQVDALIQQGIDALTVGDAKAARDAFSDAALSDPKNAKAQHGLAVAYFRLAEYQKSAAVMDKAMAIPGAVDHAMALNAGMIQMQCKQPMRAAKIARDYLNSKPLPLDEPVANLLGYSLEHADGQQQKTSFYAETRAFYDHYVHKMEAANPGQLRWGSTWLQAEQVKSIISQNTLVQPRVSSLSKELAETNNDLQSAKKKLVDLEAKLARFQTDDWAVDSARQYVSMLERQRTYKQAAYDVAVARLKLPEPIPEFTGLVALDAPCPPMESAKPIVVAISPPNDNDPTATKTAGRSGQTIVRRRPIEPTGPTDPPVAPKDSTPKDTAPKDRTRKDTTPADPTPVDPPAQPDPPVKRVVRLTTYAAAFPVSSDLVITAASAVESANDISLQTRDGSALSGSVVRTDSTTGLALVRVKGAKFYFLDLGQSKAGAISCAAMADVNIFSPTGELLTGTATAPAASWSIKLAKHPRLAGAPLIQGGKVVGVAMATRDSDIATIPAVPVAAIKALLGKDAPKSGPPADPDPILVLMQLSATRERTQE